MTTSVTAAETTVPHREMYIDGEWFDTVSHHQIRDPATGEPVATVE